MRKYREFIENEFLIDLADSAELVPFAFNKVQERYYNDLCTEYDIENKGLISPVRENIVKARREGFSSLILGLFAADDILQDNPTETAVLSYKDEATKVFRKRYRTFVLSFWARYYGYRLEDAARNVSILDEVAKRALDVDSIEFVQSRNKAHFYCGTASAKVGGRGGVVQKLLFSEVAFYPDTEKIMAAEMIEATTRQVDIRSGWVFHESTENGIGTYQHKLWVDVKRGRSRFRNRFYGWREFYTQEEFDAISSEYVDKDALRRDYPETEDDLFKGSAASFLTEADLLALIEYPDAGKEICYWLELQGVNYIDQAEILQSTLNTLSRENPHRALYAGIDVAKDRDATVLTVLRGKAYDVTGGVKGIAIDSTGVGDYLPDWFANNSRWYIEAVKFTRPMKDILYKNLQVTIADKLTAVPVLKQDGQFVSEESNHFYTQMITLEKELIGNLLVVSHPEDNQKHDTYEDGAHDDYPDSWVLAEHLYVVLNGKPMLKKKPEIPTIPNAVATLLEKGTGADRKRYGGETSYQ